MKFCLAIASLFVLNVALFAQTGQWSVERINKWQKEQGVEWYCGTNYIPSNAINYTAMWDKTSFSPDLIDKELDLAQDLGLNCVRVVLQYAVYADDPKYFLKTLDKFLSICDKHNIKVMPCFFDDCVFGANTDPVIGVQPEPLEGWYAWAWSPSPGHTMVIDERTHGKLEGYVKSVMTRFKDDNRIFVWDLYNEPINGGLGARSIPLVKKVFAWARDVNPSQPVTIGIWSGDGQLNDICVANSDIFTYHCYREKEGSLHDMKHAKSFGRPAICTEWMNRAVGSNILDILPLFKSEKVGCMMWGLINGKTQTHLPWGHRPEHLPFTGAWQHDIFKSDLTPYNVAENELIKKLCN